MNSDEYRDLKARIDEAFAKVDQRFSQVEERFTQVDEGFKQVDLRFDELRDELRGEIRTAAVETRRHFDMVYEKFREDVKPLAEGHEAHTAVLADHEGRLVRLEQARLRFDG